MTAVPVLFLYAIGVIAFILGLEETQVPKNFIYLGLSFFTNMMAYYLSYGDVAYTGTAYLPLMLMIVSILYMIYQAFGSLSSMFTDKYKTGDDE